MTAQGQKRTFQKGAIDLLILAIIAVISVAIPFTARLVQQRQEVRKEAAGNCAVCEVYNPKTCYRDVEQCSTCYETCYEKCSECLSYTYPDNQCEAWGEVDCNPYDCNPYDCNCTTVQEPYECGNCEPDPSPECNQPVGCGSGDCNTQSFNCEQDGGKCEGTKPNCSCNYPPAPASTPTTTSISTPTPTDVPVQGCTNPSGQTGDSRCDGNNLLTCVNRFGVYYWDGKTCPYGCQNSVCQDAPKAAVPTLTLTPIPTVTPEIPVSNCADPYGVSGSSRCLNGSSLAVCVNRFGTYFWDGRNCPYGCQEEKGNTYCGQAPTSTPIPTSTPTPQLPLRLPATGDAPPSGTTPAPAAAPASQTTPVPAKEEADPCILHKSDPVNYDNCQRAILIGGSEGDKNQYVEVDAQGRVTAIKWNTFTAADVNAQNAKKGLEQVLKDTGVCSTFLGADKTNCETAVALGVAEGDWQKYIQYVGGLPTVAWQNLAGRMPDFKEDNVTTMDQIKKINTLLASNSSLSLALVNTKSDLIQKYYKEEAAKIISETPIENPKTVTIGSKKTCLLNCLEIYSDSMTECQQICNGKRVVSECNPETGKYDFKYFNLNGDLLNSGSTEISCVEEPSAPIALIPRCNGNEVELYQGSKIVGGQTCIYGCKDGECLSSPPAWEYPEETGPCYETCIRDFDEKTCQNLCDETSRYHCPDDMEEVYRDNKKNCRLKGVPEVVCSSDPALAGNYYSSVKDGKLYCSSVEETPILGQRYWWLAGDLKEIPAASADTNVPFSVRYLMAESPYQKQLLINREYYQNNNPDAAEARVSAALTNCTESGTFIISSICGFINPLQYGHAQMVAKDLKDEIYQEMKDVGVENSELWKLAKKDNAVARNVIAYGLEDRMQNGDLGNKIGAFSGMVLLQTGAVVQTLPFGTQTEMVGWYENNIAQYYKTPNDTGERTKTALVSSFMPTFEIVGLGGAESYIFSGLGKIASKTYKAVDSRISKPISSLLDNFRIPDLSALRSGKQLLIDAEDVSVTRIANRALRNENDEVLRTAMLSAEDKLALELERQQIAEKAFKDALGARRLDPQDAAALALEERRTLELTTAELRLSAARVEVDLADVKKALVNAPDDLDLLKRVKTLQDELDEYAVYISEAQRAENLAKATALRNLQAETAEAIAARRASDEALEQAQREVAAQAEREAAEQAAKEAGGIVPAVPVEPNAIQRIPAVVGDGLDAARQGIRDAGTNLRTRVDDFTAGRKAVRDAGIASRLEAEKVAQEAAEKAKNEALVQAKKEAAAKAEKKAAELEAKKQAEIATKEQAQQARREAERKAAEAQKKAEEAFRKEEEARLAKIEQEAVVIKQKRIGQINTEVVSRVNRDLDETLSKAIKEEKIASLPEAEVKSLLETTMGSRFDDWLRPASTGNSYLFDQTYKKLIDAGIPAAEAQDLARQIEARFVGSKSQIVSQQIDRIKITKQKVAGRVEVAIGDMHGDSQQMAYLLSGDKGDAFGNKAPLKIIDPKSNKWVGESSIVHSTGDLFDRAPAGQSSVDAARQAKQWQQEARRIGGDLSITLGNHDVNAIYQARTGRPLITPALTPSDLSKLQRDQELLNWVMEQPAIVKSGRTVYIHSDSLVYLEYGRNLDEINANIRNILLNNRATFINSEGQRVTKTLEDLVGDLTEGRGGLTGRNVDRMLQFFDADKIVHGHTRGVAAIDSRVTNVDFGLSGGYNEAANRGKIAVTAKTPDSIVNKIELTNLSLSQASNQNTVQAVLSRIAGNERGSVQLGLISGADLLNNLNHIPDLLPGGKGIIRAGTEILPEVKTFWRGLRDEFGRWQWPWGKNEYYKSSQLFDQTVSMKIYRADKDVVKMATYTPDKIGLLDELPPHTVVSTNNNTFAKDLNGKWQPREQFIEIWGGEMIVDYPRIESRYKKLEERKWPIPLFHGTPDKSAKSIIASKQHYMQNASFTDFLGYAAGYSDEDTFTVLIYNLPPSDMIRMKSMGGDKFFPAGTNFPYMKKTADGKIYMDLSYVFDYPDSPELRAYLESMEIKYEIKDGQIKVPLYRGLSSNNSINDAVSIWPREWDDDLKINQNVIKFKDGVEINVMDTKLPIIVSSN